MTLESRTAEYLAKLSEMGTSDSRSAFLYVVYGDAPFLRAVDYEGPAREFCRRLVERLDRLGALADGSDALEVLLAATKTPDLGQDDQQVCDKLIAEWRIQRRGRPAPDTEESEPYKGLDFFDVGDANLFFGRDRLTAELAAYLCDHRLLAVVGASGSGKSSVVRAGVAPALKTGKHLKEDDRRPVSSERWPVYIITPTAQPLRELAVALTRESESVTAATTLLDDLAKDERSLDICARRLLKQRDSGDRLLLIVDQFEELFTLCRDRAERKAFVDNLLAAAAPDGVTTVILTLRADFYAHCAEFENLRQALESCQRYIGAMSEDELRQAIEAPAAQGGWELEPGLVELMLEDVAAEPGALPLLSHALLETWKRRSGRTLTLAGYQASGRVQGAIAKTADSTLAGLTPPQQAIARSIFLRLTELGEGVQDTRRRVPLEELVPGPDAATDVVAVLQTLQSARLVTTVREEMHEGEQVEAAPQMYVDVAHEALIREWPALREWLADDREGLRTHRRLTEAAQEWVRLKKDLGALYRGVRLEQAQAWAAEHAGEMNEQERAFLEASQEQVEADLREKERIEREREEARQREIVAAQALAEEADARRRVETARAEEAEASARQQAESAQKLHRRAISLGVALLVAIVGVIAAMMFFVQAQDRADEANRQRNLAQAGATAEAVAKGTAEANATVASRAEVTAVAAQATSEANLGLAERKLKEFEGERLLAEARELKEALKPEAAIDKLQAAAAADPNLRIDLSAEISDTMRYVATAWVQQGEELLRQAGEDESLREQATISATTLFSQALVLNPPSDTPVYVWIPPGEFLMGSDPEADSLAQDAEKPQHTVYVDGFWIMRTEVTNAQYNHCVGKGGCAVSAIERQHPRFADQPVIGVDWYQAREYAGWVGGRLPTEAEWEKACRGTEGKLYPWGDDPPSPDRLNYYESGQGDAVDAGSYPPGAYGLYDMAGNVWEWTSSKYAPYPYDPDDGREGPEGGDDRTLRGRSFWDLDYSMPCTYRAWDDPLNGNDDLGIRVVWSPGK